MPVKQLSSVQPATIFDGQIAALLDSLGLPFGQTAEAVIVLVLTTLVLYVVGRAVGLRIVDRLMDAREVDQHLQLVLLKGVHLLVIAAALGAGLFASGFTFLLGALVAGLAAGGLSIGFALQGAVKNVVAGLFLYAEKPFRIGDEIEWDGNAGTVVDIKFRVTRVRSFDNKLMTVPNSKLTEGVTKNPVKEGPLRLELHIPVDLKAEVEAVKAVILDEAQGHDQVLENPGPAVNLLEFEESRLLLQAWIWVANHDIGNRVTILDEFATAVKNRLDEENIEIPYPHRRLSMAPEPDGS